MMNLAFKYVPGSNGRALWFGIIFLLFYFFLFFRIYFSGFMGMNFYVPDIFIRNHVFLVRQMFSNFLSCYIIDKIFLKIGFLSKLASFFGFILFLFGEYN